jgi:hypothetical protein
MGLSERETIAAAKKKAYAENDRLEKELREHENKYFDDGIKNLISKLGHPNIQTLYNNCKFSYNKSNNQLHDISHLSQKEIKLIQKTSDYQKSCLIPVLQYTMLEARKQFGPSNQLTIDSLDLIINILMDRTTHTDVTLQYYYVKEIYVFILLKQMLNNTYFSQYDSSIDTPVTYSNNIEQAHKNACSKLKEFNIDISRFKDNSTVQYSATHFLQHGEREYQSLCTIPYCNRYLLEKTAHKSIFTLNITDLSVYEKPGFLTELFSSCLSTPEKPIDFSEVNSLLVGENPTTHYCG